MARELSTIYNEIIAEKETLSTLKSQLTPFPDNFSNLLSSISSGSKVAVWRLWVWITAYAIWMFEKIQDTFKAEITDLISSTRFGTLPWYQEIAFSFQYGDSLVYSNYIFAYAAVDASKQIIKRAAATSNGGEIRLKVAKLTGTSPVKLSSAELLAFNAYITDLKPPGETVLVISTDADLLKLQAEIIYDPQVIKSDGSKISDGSFPVEDAINDYLNDIPWDGVFNMRKWQDAIQAVEGVVDVIPGGCYGKTYAAATYSTIVNNYFSVAGYMIIDPANPLSATLTYTASV